MKKRIFALILALCLCVMLLPTAAFADGKVAVNEENFPDEIFRNYVLAYIDADEDGALSDEERAEVTKLDVSGQKIASLKGIEYFTGLTFLNCAGNKLTSLDVSKNTALTALGCDSNSITELNVSGAAALTVLSCTFNAIEELDVSNNTELTSLECFWNVLTELDVSKNTKLTKLNCGANALTELDVSNNTALTALDCNANALTELDVSNNTELKELYCYENELTALDLSKNTALKTLRCENNSIAALDLSDNKALSAEESRIWQRIFLTAPLNGFDLATLVGAENLAQIALVEGGSLNNGIITCEGNELSYYYDTKSELGNMQVILTGKTVGPQDKFTDAVPEDHWAYESINYVLRRGIMSGTSETTFEPNGTVTRAMVAVMLYNLEGEPDVTIDNPFTDVPDTWFTTPIIWAYENGIVSGYEDGTFNPNGEITREQLAIMMQNFASYWKINTSVDYDLSKFADADKVSSWASDSIKWACANEIVHGSEDGGKLYLNPQGNATRAQMAVIFQNFCEKF